MTLQGDPITLVDESTRGRALEVWSTTDGRQFVAEITIDGRSTRSRISRKQAGHLSRWLSDKIAATSPEQAALRNIEEAVARPGESAAEFAVRLQIMASNVLNQLRGV